MAEELDKLLRPILMRENLLDKSEYSRINDLINEWTPEKELEQEQEKVVHCAQIQAVLIGLLPICKKQQEIKVAVKEYSEYLSKKATNEDLFNDYSVSHEKTTKRGKLEKRYIAISKLNKDIKDKDFLDDNDIKNAKDALSICLDNKPNWSERSFLQKLTDVLSMGFKPLYRAFFSKEKELEKKLGDELSQSKGPN